MQLELGFFYFRRLYWTPRLHQHSFVLNSDITRAKAGQFLGASDCVKRLKINFCNAFVHQFPLTKKEAEQEHNGLAHLLLHASLALIISRLRSHTDL